MKAVDRTDPRWLRIRASITFTSSDIVADRHADFVYSIVERIQPPDEPAPGVARKRTPPAKPKPVVLSDEDCHDCNGMGYLPSPGRCDSCGGKGKLPALDVALEGRARRVRGPA